MAAGKASSVDLRLDRIKTVKALGRLQVRLEDIYLGT